MRRRRPSKRFPRQLEPRSEVFHRGIAQAERGHQATRSQREGLVLLAFFARLGSLFAPDSILILSSAQMRVAAIFGPGCSPKNLERFDRAAQACSQNIEWQIGLPSPPDHKESRSGNQNEAQAELVLLFGGDGTIHRHLGSLVDLGLPVLIAPAGSGNDFARALGLPHMKDSLAAWRAYCSDRNNVLAVDLGFVTPSSDHTSTSPDAPRDLPTANGRYFCSVAGIGLDAEVARRANAMPRWLRRHGGYALSLARSVFRFAPLPMKILSAETPAQWTVRSSQPTMLAAFANSSTYGGGMKIAPRARIDDGALDVCVVAGIDPFKLACMFPTIYFGRHLQVREVQYFQSDRLRVETETPLDVYGDGEYMCRTPVEVSVQPRALRVVVASLPSALFPATPGKPETKNGN
jgi:diacylglycerol kinase (ATP)